MIKLTPDRTTLVAYGQSLSYTTVELVDANGILNQKADKILKFEMSGPGTILAVANPNPISVESFQRKERKAWKEMSRDH